MAFITAFITAVIIITTKLNFTTTIIIATIIAIIIIVAIVIMIKAFIPLLAKRNSCQWALKHFPTKKIFLEMWTLETN